MSDTDLPPLIETRPGLYRHYRHLYYEVLGTARHSETLEPMTLYRALYGQRGLWVRPAAMFEEEVVVDGVRQPRFAWVGPPGTEVPAEAPTEALTEAPGDAPTARAQNSAQ